MKRENGPTTTPPKLSFHSLPAQRPEPPGMATPPLRRPGSVPFRWEEAPGKPRAVASRSTSKGLDLPPKIVARMMPSVDEPNPKPSCRLCYSVSLREGRLSSSSPSIRSAVGRRGGRRERARWRMMTWPWRKGSIGRFEDASTPSSVSSGSSSSSSFSSSSEFNFNSNNYEGKTATMRMMRRSRSLSDAGSHWLANIYGVIRQVIPRRMD